MTTNSKNKNHLNQKSKTILDVRSPIEFQGGHVEGSLNIPLQEIMNKIDQIKKLPKPIILCCASGMRSHQATILLQNQGIDCQNGGSWLDINF